MATSVLDALSPHDRALVMMAVLLDGHEAESFLGADPTHASLSRAASELLRLPIELRTTLIGTTLRRTLKSLGQAQSGLR